MKKIWLGFLCILVLGGCAAQKEAPFLSIEGASYAVLREMGASVTIQDEGALSQLQEMFTAPQYEQGESNEDWVGWEYSLEWYDEAGEPLDGLVVHGPQVIDRDGYFWSLSGGEIDMEYLSGLMEESYLFLHIQPDWVVLRDEETGLSMNLPGLMPDWLLHPFEKAGPAGDSTPGYTLELYDEEGKEQAVLTHITATGFCMGGDAYRTVYDEGLDVEQMGTFLAASQGDDEALDALDIKAMTVDNKEHTAYIEDRDAIKEVLAMFAGLGREELGEALSEEYYDYDFAIAFIEGFSGWGLYACRLSGDHIDAGRLNELAENSAVEKVFPEDWLYFHDIDHIELTGSGKTVQVKGDNPLSLGLDGSSLAVMEVFRNLCVEKAGPAEESRQEVYYTVAWVDGAGVTRREISICADCTLLYDGFVHTITSGYFDTTGLMDLLEGDGKLPLGSPQPTAAAE